MNIKPVILAFVSSSLAAQPPPPFEQPYCAVGTDAPDWTPKDGDESTLLCHPPQFDNGDLHRENREGGNSSILLAVHDEEDDRGSIFGAYLVVVRYLTGYKHPSNDKGNHIQLAIDKGQALMASSNLDAALLALVLAAGLATALAAAVFTVVTTLGFMVAGWRTEEEWGALVEWGLAE